MPPSAIPPPPGTNPPPSDSHGERRAVDRAHITLKVDYKRLNSFFADYTRNISKGGTFIRTVRPLDVGTEFTFVLALPSSEEPLKLTGEVKWVVAESAATEEQPPGMGIKFKFEKPGERERVEMFVEKLMNDALGEHISQKLLAKKPV